MNDQDTSQKDAQSTDPYIGQVIQNRYKIVRKLGDGGMGTVYEGVHVVIGKRVAIKILHAEHASNEGLVTRFINEARAAATLHHPNIIDAVDVGTTDSHQPFIVLEFLEGNDLTSLIRREHSLSVATTVRIVKQICSALSAAHARKIIHRDLKPDNIFLLSGQQNELMVKVLDFGISKFIDGSAKQTRAGAILGTPTYMPPEQLFDSSAVDHRSDIYSLGVIIYQCLTGKLPFASDSFPDLVRRILSEEPAPLQSLRPDLPAGLVALVNRMMAKNSSERPQSVDQVAKEIAIFELTAERPVGVSTQPLNAMSPNQVKPNQAVEFANTQYSQVDTPKSPTASDGSRLPSIAVTRACPHCKEKIGRETVCPFCGVNLDDPRIGEVLSDRYRIDKLLGAGGVGRVYRGTHLQLGESVAIKFLLADWTAKADFRARFKREAVTLARLRHPSIVSVLDYGEHAGELFMVMEFVKGGALRDKMLRGSPMPIPQALKYTELILDVMEFSHGQKIVHRDLKPENIMMLELGDNVDRLKILDFGLALETTTADAERITAIHAVQGTPAYMSPEQCKGRDVGPPTDIYAIGIMLFEMLSGEPPFQGMSVNEILIGHMFMEPQRICEVGVKRQVPEAIERIVAQALAKDPATRPTATQFKTIIGQILRGDDAVSIAEQSAKEKVLAAMTDREQRAVLPLTAKAPTSTSTQVRAKVVFWGFSQARIDQMRAGLTLNNVDLVVCPQGQPPIPMVDGAPTKVIAIPWDADASAKLAKIKTVPQLAKVQIAALDANDVEDMPAIIRAGASDVAYRTTPLEALAKQLAKLYRRAK